MTLRAVLPRKAEAPCGGNGASATRGKIWFYSIDRRPEWISYFLLVFFMCVTFGASRFHLHLTRSDGGRGRRFPSPSLESVSCSRLAR